MKNVVTNAIKTLKQDVEMNRSSEIEAPNTIKQKNTMRQITSAKKIKKAIIQLTSFVPMNIMIRPQTMIAKPIKVFVVSFLKNDSIQIQAFAAYFERSQSEAHADLSVNLNAEVHLLVASG